ncbi:MAG: hypothetical protein KF729_24135 [Sandaracinaceae bacterium]|nr:hypothetical protein [Sandaracinaceae bacterium]
MKKTLEDKDIETERGLSRRSTIGLIGASFAAMTGVLGISPSEAEAQCTDSDGGRWADPGGGGRRCRRSGCSDSDGGRFADPAGAGRRCSGGVVVQPRGGCTDSDGGRWADGAGRGRRCGGGGVRTCSDSDGGRWADGAGRGRRC